MSTSSAPRTDSFAAKAREILTNLSGIPEEDLTGNATFLELGFDSLLLTKVSKGIYDGFGAELKMRQLMTDISTFDALVEHLDEVLPPEQLRETKTVDIVQTPAPVQVPQQQVVPQVQTPTPVQIDNGTVKSLILQQMDIMRQQLALLGCESNPVEPSSKSINPVAEMINPVAASLTTPRTKTKSSAKISGTKSESSAPSTAINRELDDSLTDAQQRHIEALVEKYTTRTQSSKRLTTEYRQWYADPRTVSGFNRLWKEMIYQIVVDKSKGSRLLDIDGNEYIDLLNGFGPGFLGHSPDFFTEALHEQLDRGVEVGPQCQTAMEAAKLFCEVTGAERASFVNTGSEAVQAAMRLSRTVTGRDKVVVFEKDYHGNFDEVLVRGIGSDEKLRSMPVAPGIPIRAVEDVIVLPYGTPESLEYIRHRANELAAVIVEPVQSRRPELQPREFIQELRAITQESGTAFVFDEVNTGFRVGPHGAQGFFDVEADIATYGKVVGGGMPIGIVAGKAEFMDAFDGGQWQFGDDSFPEQGVTFFSGTFVRHPLAMVAVKQMLLHLKASGPKLWTKLNAKANRLASTVNQLFQDNDVPFEMPNFGSLMFIRPIDDNKYANLLFFHLRSKGIFLLEGFPSYITTSHTDADINYAIAAFKDSIAEMQEAGFFPKPSSHTLHRKNLTGPTPILSKGIKPATEPVYPLTEPLAEIWFASQASDDGTLCFNEVVSLTFEGELDVSAMQGAVQDLVNRHEALRATFNENGEGFQIKDELKIDLQVADKKGDELDLERTTKFDLENGPLFRARLLRVSDQKHELILNAHHLVCDGRSYNVVISDLRQCYAARVNGEPVTLDPAPRFGSYAQAEIEAERHREGGDSEKYWLAQFEQPVPPLNLPKDSTGEMTHQSDAVTDRVDAETLAELKKTAGKSDSTLFAVLMGGYQILLNRITRQNRLLTVFPVAGQNDDRGNENLVGHCVNFLPFPGELDASEKLSGFLKTTQANLLDALEHQDYTFGQMLKKLPGANRPVAEAVFNLEQMDGYGEFSGLKTSIQDVARKFSHNPLFLNVIENDDSLELDLRFQTDLISKETSQLWLNNYLEILNRMIQTPDATVGEISSSIDSDQLELLGSWNDTKTDYPGFKTVGELFDRVANEHRENIAVSHEERDITYAELKTMAAKIAHHLGGSGVCRGDRVGLFLEQSPERIAALFAILKLGAAYVPFDPEYPEERIDLMLADSGASAVITEKSLASRVSGKINKVIDVAEAIENGNAKEANITFKGKKNSKSPAYVIYTSGSTGTPKGAVIPHRAIVRLVRNTNYCKLDKNQTILQAASICFDASIFEIFGALLNGGTLALPPAGSLSVSGIAETIAEKKVTTLWLTSGLFQLMVEEDIAAFKGVRQLLTGGDVVPVKHVASVMKEHKDLTVINGYGPTENTTFTCCHTITEQDLAKNSLPIGRPISNTTAWILDQNNNPVPPGIAGELCCGGDGLAIEYLNAPELTQEKFFLADLGGSSETRLYRTGDLCRYRADGAIEFLGRIDHQIKIRGFQVEPGEIEARLVDNPKVGQCKVVTRGDDAGDKTLVAFVSPKNGSRPDPDELCQFLSDKLPAYMVPNNCVVVDEIPVTPNGKVDTVALKSSGVETKRATTNSEVRLTSIWQDVLKVPSIGLDDDFFQLGGHSLLGMKLFRRIQNEFGASLPLSALFNASTVRKLAREIDSRSNGSTRVSKGYRNLINERDEPSALSGVAEHTVTLQPKGDRSPIFGVHGGDGGVFFYRNLAGLLKHDRPFHAFEASVLTNGGDIPETTVENTAARYVEELLKIQARWTG